MICVRFDIRPIKWCPLRQKSHSAGCFNGKKLNGANAKEGNFSHSRLATVNEAMKVIYTHIFGKRIDTIVFMGVGTVSYAIRDYSLPKEKQLWELIKAEYHG